MNQKNTGENKNNKSIKHIRNKTDIPDNILYKNNELIHKCEIIQSELPRFLRDFFLYIKNGLSISSRLAYLSDIKFFFDYLVNHHENFLEFNTPYEVTIDKFTLLSAKDINFFIGEYASRYYLEYEKNTVVYENHNRSLARKKSSLSVMFKFLYRNGDIPNNIVDGFNPIKLPKPQPDAIKKLEVEEMMKLLSIVESGEGLTEKEKQYWEKTKLRDKAILLLFVTYGLRVSELVQLDLGSINFSREEFKIYRKRGKESIMPLNNSVINALKNYIEIERLNSIENDEPLFLSLQGKRLTTRAVRELVNKYTSIAMNTSRENGYSPHKLRATAASTLIEFGFSIYDVQNLLDHENVTTTQLYASHKKNSKRDMIRNYELDSEL